MAAAMLLRGADYEGKRICEEAAGQTPSAAHEEYELLCVTKGSAEYWVEDQFYKLTTGDILVLPAGVMVTATLKTRGCPFERYTARMSRRFMAFLKQQDFDADYCFRQAAAEHRHVLRLPEDQFAAMLNAFKTISDECQSSQMNAELHTKALLSLLCVQLNRLAANKNGYLCTGTSNRLSPVLTYIHAQCTTALAVENLAEQFGYSASHLAHSFKKQMGTSLYHYVLLRRLQIGREAMIGGIPVKEAYQRCGFGDYAGFYRAFIKEFGLSPQQYKKKNA